MASIKGSQLVGVIKPLRGLREQAEAQIPERLRFYLSDRVLLGAWYPEADFRDLLLLLGGILAPMIEGNVWRFLGASGADRDFTGVYAALIRVGDPTWTVRQMPAGWGLIRDNGQLSVAAIGDGHAELVLRDYPFISPELAEVNAAYFEGALHTARADNPEVQVRRVEPDGAVYVLRWG